MKSKCEAYLRERLLNSLYVLKLLNIMDERRVVHKQDCNGWPKRMMVAINFQNLVSSERSDTLGEIICVNYTPILNSEC